MPDAHPELRAGTVARGTMLAKGVAYAPATAVQFEQAAKQNHVEGPRNQDKETQDVMKLAPTQTGDSVPPKSIVRHMAFAKLHSRILAVAEATHAVALHNTMELDQQTTTLSGWEAWHGNDTDEHEQVSSAVGAERALANGDGVAAGNAA